MQSLREIPITKELQRKNSSKEIFRARNIPRDALLGKVNN